MLKSNKFKWLYFAALSTLVVTFAFAPANALPGQNINTVLKWVKTKPQLPTLTYSSETLTYYGTRDNLSFHVSVDQQKVRSESISVNGDSKLRFTQKNAKAVKFLQDIYGSNIANDFKNARYVTKISDIHFYRGQKFAYTVFEFEGGTDLPGSSGFEIIPLNKLQQDIDNTKYCQTNQCDI
ncbi:hypothetical protein [aff. Roholtiella sp. LEGE 12411]|uniref:hypothetical protein n=1 Tax=aff. Roholtiella sp. LEGE 12411 TaxID=1828822 RepID=UPI00187F9E4B|nr:hypothetical protein [aff. Roholtiella sp. LEGE 12411]MBE9034216.1 hypothetical protein [aff. Roholtiella sp. LEGE 12411]